MLPGSTDEVSAAFPWLLSFAWLPPFVCIDFFFFFKHCAVMKPLEQLPGLSINEILQVLPARHSEGPEDPKHAFGYEGSLRPGCATGLSLVTSTPCTGRDSSDHNPSLYLLWWPVPKRIASDTWGGEGPPTKKESDPKGILWQGRPASSSDVPTGLCCKY